MRISLFTGLPGMTGFQNKGAFAANTLDQAFCQKFFKNHPHCSA